MLARFGLLPALALLVALPLAAEDFETGRAAYESGDYAETFRELRPLAERGHAGSQFLIGKMYYQGRGVGKDPREAGRWFLKAAEQGDLQAQYYLGVLHASGEGVPQDDVRAYMWLYLAAEKGNELANVGLGVVMRRLTPAEQAEGRRLVQRWKKAHAAGPGRQGPR
jgi:hypothetical protein